MAGRRPGTELLRVGEDADAHCARLGASRLGLSTRDVVERRRRAKRNPRNRRPSLGALRDLLRTWVSPLDMILLLAAGASAMLGEHVNAIVITAIVLLSGSIGVGQRVRSDRAVAKLKGQVSPTATVRRDGVWADVVRDELVPGDIVRLAAGDLVPADCRLLQSSDLYVQQAALTGESSPAEKLVAPGGLALCSPESPELVFLGTSVVSGSAEALVFACGADTQFGDVVERLAARPAETEFERGTRQFGTFILQTVFVLVLFILVVSLAMHRDPFSSLLFAVALAVGLTPEFLPMITTVTLATGALRMAKEKVIVKHLPAIQNLGSMDILCSDKTGTLTSGAMSLDDSLDPFGQPCAEVLVVAALNSRFETGIKSPLDAAILARAPASTTTYEKTDEIPFDFERRRLSVIVRDASTSMLVTKGAPESVLAVCVGYEQAGVHHPFDDASRAAARTAVHDAEQQGFRVLAVARRVVERAAGFRAADERDLVLVGFLTFADHLLDGVAASFARLAADGVAVKILTGDSDVVAQHICAQVGVDASRMVLGSELDDKSEIALARIAEDNTLFARVSPAQKQRIIRALQGAGHVVGFLGDGINDAPSLHAADVGISVAGAVDVAREAADIVLLEKRLDVLHAGILSGRDSFGNVLKYLLMGTSSNFGNMFSMAGASVVLPFLPMLPTQILLNNFLYDLAQITIPTDAVDPEMRRRPHRWDISIIRRFMLLIGPLSSIYDFLTFYVLYRVFHYAQPAFQTGWFVESLVTQVLVVFVIRTVQRPWKSRPSGPLAATALAVTVLGVALPFTRLAHWVGLVPLPLGYFGFLVPVVATYLVLVELVKQRVMGRLYRAPQAPPPAQPVQLERA